MVKGTQNTRSKKENKNKFLPEAPNEKSAVNGNRMQQQAEVGGWHA